MTWQHRDPLEGDWLDPEPPDEDLPLDEDAPIPLELLEDEAMEPDVLEPVRVQR